jgi:hypothetical protein
MDTMRFLTENKNKFTAWNDENIFPIFFLARNNKKKVKSYYCINWGYFFPFKGSQFPSLLTLPLLPLNSTTTVAIVDDYFLNKN